MIRRVKTICVQAWYVTGGLECVSNPFSCPPVITCSSRLPVYNSIANFRQTTHLKDILQDEVGYEQAYISMILHTYDSTVLVCASAGKACIRYLQNVYRSQNTVFSRDILDLAGSHNSSW